MQVIHVRIILWLCNAKRMKSYVIFTSCHFNIGWASKGPQVLLTWKYLRSNFFFSLIAAKVFSKIHLYIPVALVTPKYQSRQNELSETKAEKYEVWFSSRRQMPTAFSTGSAFYKWIQWLPELKIRLSASIKLCDSIKKPFNLHCISLIVVWTAAAVNWFSFTK